MGKPKVKRGRHINRPLYNGYAWICLACGREWMTRTLARSCEKNGHPNEVLFHYHDAVARPLNLEEFE